MGPIWQKVKEFFTKKTTKFSQPLNYPFSSVCHTMGSQVSMGATACKYFVQTLGDITFQSIPWHCDIP